MLIKTFGNWFYAVVFKDAWWRFHPRDWEHIKLSKDKLTQKLVHFDQLPELYRRKGMKIHSIRCKVCGDTWFTTCKADLCNRLGCWVKYYGRLNNN